LNFNGAAEYYFFKGVKFAQDCPHKSLILEVEDLIAIECKVADKCREAFMLGYELGLAMTRTDYKHLTTEPIPAIKKSGIILKKKRDKKPDVLDKEYPIKGNC